MRIRLIAFACAAVAFCLAGVAGAAGSSGPPVLVRTGDAPSPFDITRLDVTEQGDGSVYLQVTVAGRVNWDEDGPLVALDLDQNPDTGSAFYGTEVEIAFQGEGNAREGEPVLLRAHGWGFKRALQPARLAWTLGPHIVGFSVDRSDLGLSPTAGF